MVPEHGSVQEALTVATETCRRNLTYNMDSAQVAAPNGETVTIFDEDAGR